MTSVAAPALTDDVLSLVRGLIAQINRNLLTPDSVIGSINMYLEEFDQLQNKHMLSKPLNDVKAAFLAKFPAPVASDEHIKCFDDWITRCGAVPARGNPSATGTDPVIQIFEPEVHFRAFNTTMESGMLQSFIVFLASIWTHFTDSKYHKYFTVVQSSGWGKTRLMDLLCKTYQRVLIYACFRSTDSPESGYPRGVKAVKDAFLAIQDRALGTRLRVCQNLLRAVVQLACADNARTFMDGLIDDPESLSYEDLWTRALALSETQTFYSKYLEWLSSSIGPKVGPMIEIPEPKADNFKVFLVFDEISYLLRSKFDIIVTAQEWDLKKPDSVEPFAVTAFRLLRRALYNLQREFVHLGVVAVFIDTHSSISNFAPTAGSEPSARDRRLGSAPASLPVYWQINAEPTMFTGLDLFLFGRPMIGGYYNAVQDILLSEAAVIQKKEASVIELCEIKMQDPDVSKDWVAATMSCLLDLEIRAGSALPDALIRSYMATCLDVSEDREKITTHYPCEPVLARGALNNLLGLDSNHLHVALQHFQQLQRQADLGTRGETVAELICLLMLDYCRSFDAKFSLTTFLSRLLGWPETHISQHLFRVFQINDLKQSPTLNLCQFQLFEQYPTPEEIERCHRLGLGIMMVVNAAAIDMVIPLRLHDGRYSAIVLQIKNWKQHVGPGAAKSLLDEIGWVRVFESVTNKAFGKHRASIVPETEAESAKPARRARKSAAVAVSSASASDNPVFKKSGKRSAKRTIASIDEPIELVSELPPRVLDLQDNFKDVPYCKLLLLMRDHDDNELFVEENEMETVLCGVLRGIPTEHGVFRNADVCRIFQSMVADYHTRRFAVNDESNMNARNRQLFINNLFANSVHNIL